MTAASKTAEESSSLSTHANLLNYLAAAGRNVENAEVKRVPLLQFASDYRLNYGQDQALRKHPIIAFSSWT